MAMAVICPRCGRRLRKKDVEVVKDVFVTKGENGLLKEILLAKIAFCRFCGHKLDERKFAGHDWVHELMQESGSSPHPLTVGEE